MRSDAKGNAFQSRGRWFARPSLGAGKRKAVLLPQATDQTSAEARAGFIAGLVGQVRRAGKAGIVDLAGIVKEAANAATAEELANLQTIVDEICGGKSLPKPAAGSGASATTFGELSDDWTTGKLHDRHPDYVKTKRSAQDDEGRLAKHILPHVKDVRIVDFTLKHALGVMTQLPAKLRPATRRQVAQLMSRVLNLAVFPCQIIPASPLPRGFLPKTGTPRVSAYLYPAEDAKLLAASPEKVPLCWRIFFGFLDREGCRTSEAAALLWRDIDLENGVLTLDKNKTNRPRHWKLNAGVTRALKLWRAHRGDPKSTEPVFVDIEGAKIEGTELEDMADTFRVYLKAAGVDRPQLFDDNDQRRQIRAHDLRATMVTISLEVEERSESWVMRRTGHTTSAMLTRYRKQFETASELEHGSLRALDEAIPELAKLAAKGGGGGSGEREDLTTPPENTSESDSLGPIAQLVEQRTLNTASPTPEAARTPIADSEADTAQQLGTSAASSLPPDFDPIAKAIADGQYDVARELLAELKLQREERAGNVVRLPPAGRKDSR